MTKLPWGFAKAFFIGAGEGRVVFKSTFIADICDRSAGKDHFAGKEKPFGRQIASNAITGLFPERMHQVIAAQVESGREIVNGDGFRQMTV